MADSDTKKNKQYGAKAIRVMEGLEAVRKRPAMYIGSTGPQGLHHLVYEVVDNSVDEALAGHCDNVKVILHDDGSVSVEDNGRGIPTDIHPTEKISAAEVVLTKLHAGGKFDKDSYKFSGGLHGVGISVVNALSSDLEVLIYRDGNIHQQKFSKGKPLGPLEVIGTTDKRGTYIRFTPDKKIFTETTDFSFDTLSARLRELAFLNKGLRILIVDEKNNKKHDFFFEGGISSFVEHVNSKKTPLFPEIIHFQNEDEQYVLEVAMQYNDGYGEQLYSFVNNINTAEGGTHVAGFKSALTKVCNRKAQSMNALKSGESFSSDDVREGLVGVISIKVPEPQFEGQTKTKLGNSEVKGIVDSWTFSFLDSFFEENPAIIKKILQKAELAKRARDAAKKARELTRRKTVLESTILPGKLADCTSETPSETELFIVEGDSAGGSAKQGRDRMYQAILPLRGKVLNVEKARLDRVLSNEEIKALIAAIGCGFGVEEFDAEKARYHKIILMADADVDGAHITALLLTFFFRHMRPLIEAGYLYIAQPPLYKVKIGKKEQYIKDDSAFAAFLFEWAKEQTMLMSNNKDIGTDTWITLLDELLAYEKLLQREAQEYRMTIDKAHRIVRFLLNNPWHKEDGINALVDSLQKEFAEFLVGIITQEANEEQEIPAETFISFKQLNQQWTVSLDFFTSKDTQRLIDHLKPLNIIDEQPWKLHMVGRERAVEGQGALDLHRGMIKISKPYMNVQRYKGLGEMNPEQLWETSMDKKQRQLLQVKIEDELAADSWFATLMGDDVAGRKKYIAENSHFVKNLDV